MEMEKGKTMDKFGQRIEERFASKQISLEYRRSKKIKIYRLSYTLPDVKAFEP